MYLQPGETACGQLDSWPVRPLKPTSSTLPISHSANPKLAHLAERQARQNQLASARGLSVIPKPKVLERLESHLEKELRLLGCPSVGPHELRLQVSKVLVMATSIIRVHALLPASVRLLIIGITAATIIRPVLVQQCNISRFKYMQV